MWMTSLFCVYCLSPASCPPSPSALSSTPPSPAELLVVRRFSRSPLQLFAQWETDMTILQDAEVETAPLLPLAPGEPRALIAILSSAKRNALVACFNANGLQKKDGAWHGSPDGKPVSGVTVADLARDGMLTVTTEYRLCSAPVLALGKLVPPPLLPIATSVRVLHPVALPR